MSESPVILCQGSRWDDCIQQFIQKEVFILKTKEYVDAILKKILENFEDPGGEGIENVQGLKAYNPILKDGGSSYYSDQIGQKLYLLKYAYAYGFEYLFMCNELIEDLLKDKDKREISVVSLGCGTKIDYWALVYMLNMRKKDAVDKGGTDKERPVVKYHGVDAVAWDHSLDAKDTGGAEKNFDFYEGSLKRFFKEPDNGFNTHDVYIFPKSIGEFSNKKDENGESDMGMLLENLSEMKQDTVYFCISLLKRNDVSPGDVKKVKMIIEKLTEEKIGFHVKEVKCITDKEETKDRLEKGLRVEGVRFIPLGDENPQKRGKYVYDEDVAENVGGYPKFPEEFKAVNNSYIKSLKTNCKHKEDKTCKECKYHGTCKLCQANPITKTRYICDLIIKFEREKKTT